MGELGQSENASHTVENIFKSYLCVILWYLN